MHYCCQFNYLLLKNNFQTKTCITDQRQRWAKGRRFQTFYSEQDTAGAENVLGTSAFDLFQCECEMNLRQQQNNGQFFPWKESTAYKAQRQFTRHMEILRGRHSWCWLVPRHSLQAMHENRVLWHFGRWKSYWTKAVSPPPPQPILVSSSTELNLARNVARYWTPQRSPSCWPLPKGWPWNPSSAGREPAAGHRQWRWRWTPRAKVTQEVERGSWTQLAFKRQLIIASSATGVNCTSFEILLHI